MGRAGKALAGVGGRQAGGPLQPRPARGRLQPHLVKHPARVPPAAHTRMHLERGREAEEGDGGEGGEQHGQGGGVHLDDGVGKLHDPGHQQAAAGGWAAAQRGGLDWREGALSPQGLARASSELVQHWKIPAAAPRFNLCSCAGSASGGCTALAQASKTAACQSGPQCPTGPAPPLGPHLNARLATTSQVTGL